MNSQNSDEIKLQLDEMKKVTTNLMKQLEIISTGLSNSSPPCEKPVENQETPVENQENIIVKNEEIVPYVKPQLKINAPSYSSRKDFYLTFVKHVIKNIDLNDHPLEHHDWNNTCVNFKDSSASKIINHINSKNDINYFDEVLSGDLINKLFNFCISGQFTLQKSNAQDNGEFSFYILIVMNNMYFHKLFYEIILPKLDIENKENLIIDRAYYNIHTFGSPGNWHTDGRSSLKYGPSILIYCNPTWHTRWEGATAYYVNKENLEMKYIDVKPGRIAVTSPHIEHRATDISAYAFANSVKRVTLIFHTIYI